MAGHTHDVAGVVVDAEDVGDGALGLDEERVGDAPRLLSEALKGVSQ